MDRRSRFDLQAKISLVLVGVILPTFLVVTIAENKLTQPILEEEIRQFGVVIAKNVASDIAGRRLLSLPERTSVIESSLQELLYSQPSVTRVDVVARNPGTGLPERIASSVEEEGSSPAPQISIVEKVTSEFRVDEEGRGEWVIQAPIQAQTRGTQSGPRKVLGTVQVVTSTQLIGRIMGALWRMTVAAAAVSTVILIVVLSYFLRKTIANDRLLRRAENHNLALTEQLHEAEREVMVNEKFAVMGQLTASFAHEIGTPLNAIGGHLQLLREELGDSGAPLAPVSSGRLQVIEGQIGKIEGIVKGFLQSTAKPPSQKQLVDLNQLVVKTLGVVAPRAESLGVAPRADLDHGIGPVRAVPVDIEQIFLNLVNNSLDSLKAKPAGREKPTLQLSTRLSTLEGRPWAVVTVYDSGTGIASSDLSKVAEPFFTTKRPGEGTGLGLSICRQLARKHGGSLEIDSKEGAWTRAILKLPYQVDA